MYIVYGNDAQGRIPPRKSAYFYAFVHDSFEYFACKNAHFRGGERFVPEFEPE